MLKDLTGLLMANSAGNFLRIRVPFFKFSQKYTMSIE